MSRYRQKLLQEGSNTHKTKTLCLGVILLHLNYDFVNVTHNFLLGLCLDMKGHNIYCLIPKSFSHVKWYAKNTSWGAGNQIF